jgi:hypothetical protein
LALVHGNAATREVPEIYRCFKRSGSILPSEKVKDKRNYQADHDGRGEGKIEPKIAALDIDIAGQPPEPGNLGAQRKQ